MTNRSKVALNFIAFQLGWLSCVLLAARDMPYIGIVITLLLVAIHLLLELHRMHALVFLILVTVIGSAWDSVLTHYGILVFSSGMIVDFLAPLWIMAMWLIFATTLTVTFRWLYGRYWVAMVLGAISGPLAYRAGSALGAVEIPNLFVASVVLAVGWAILLPLFIKLAELFQQLTSVRGEVW
ncbi:MAG: DUF2878 domain-containing protein [Gammaproteobacteria bacterium]|nr:DUF2878 domain-containing protein [Gammaproteobacteria bacterium]